MKKYLIVKKSKGKITDDIDVEKITQQTAKTNIGEIRINENTFGLKKSKQKYKNNPNKVFMKKGKRR